MRLAAAGRVSVTLLETAAPQCRLGSAQQPVPGAAARSPVTHRCSNRRQLACVTMAATAAPSPNVLSPWEEGLKAYQQVPLAAGLGKAYGENTSTPPKGRRAGVLMHPTSLPGPYGIGTIGAEAHAFVDWLATAGMQLWQVLPLVPPEDTYWSPYSGLDALCGNPLMIDLEDLVTRGLLDAADLPKQVPVADAVFQEVRKVKAPLLTRACQRLLTEDRFAALRTELMAFRKVNAWVEESALFYALTQAPGTSMMAWWDWPEDLRLRDPKAVAAAREQHKAAIELFVAEQFLFDTQWTAIKAYANSKGVSIVGDIPIYVGAQSADVWANQRLFELTDSGAPALVSGVPPDAFSETGQLWGSPLFNWAAHEEEGYKWWAQRLGRVFSMHNETRIDHFRGFAGYWAVKAGAETAMGGDWRKGPGKRLFDALTRQLGEVPIIAEDLGVITPDVVQLRQDIGAPGMAVLQFAWGSGGANTHLPHNHYENCVVYPGTHDNGTAVGWWEDEASDDDKAFLKTYLGKTEVKDPAYTLIECGMRSVGKTTIFTMQDVMRLDNEGRMNRPGRAEGNWAWRVGESGVWSKLTEEAASLKAMAEVYDRLPPHDLNVSSKGPEKP